MINFTDINMRAKDIALYYANKMENELAIKLFSGYQEITTREEAIQITDFFWNMVDEASEDQENNIQIAGTYDLEFWMEKLMNITIGYFTRCGFKDVWTDESNRINGG